MTRFARGEGLSDGSLREAVDRAERGLVDADLGNGLIKQRVARPGKGRSGGYRVIVVYRTRERAFFIYGFAKNERENIDRKDLEDLKAIAHHLLTATAVDLGRMLNAGELQEITDDNQDT